MTNDASPPARPKRPARAGLWPARSGTATRSRALNTGEAEPFVLVPDPQGPPPTQEALRAYSLVLSAKRLPHRQAPGGAGLLVPERFAQAAREEIARFQVENRTRAQPAPPPTVHKGAASAVLFVLTLLVLVHFASESLWSGFFGEYAVKPKLWVDLLALQTDAVLGRGEWSRSVTALLLHADLAHLASNVGFGLVVFLLVARRFGPGLGFFLVLAAGAIGNALSVPIRGLGHASLGASTALFAAVGLFGGAEFPDRERGFRRFLPFGAALALFAALGTDEKTDVLAHALGFFSGVGLGYLFRLMEPRLAASPWLRRRIGPLSGLSALALVAAALFARLV